MPRLELIELSSDSSDSEIDDIPLPVVKRETSQHIKPEPVASSYPASVTARNATTIRSKTLAEKKRKLRIACEEVKKIQSILVMARNRVKEAAESVAMGEQLIKAEDEEATAVKQEKTTIGNTPAAASVRRVPSSVTMPKAGRTGSIARSGISSSNSNGRGNAAAGERSNGTKGTLVKNMVDNMHGDISPLFPSSFTRFDSDNGNTPFDTPPSSGESCASTTPVSSTATSNSRCSLSTRQAKLPRTIQEAILDLPRSSRGFSCANRAPWQRSMLSAVLGGGQQTTWPGPDKRKIYPYMLNCAYYICVRRDLNQWLPKNPGDAGALTLFRHDKASCGAVYPLFIAERGGWVYYGDYKIVQHPINDGFISREQWRQHFKGVNEKKRWCSHILSKGWGRKQLLQKAIIDNSQMDLKNNLKDSMPPEHLLPYFELDNDKPQRLRLLLRLLEPYKYNIPLVNALRSGVGELPLPLDVAPPTPGHLPSHSSQGAGGQEEGEEGSGPSTSRLLFAASEDDEACEPLAENVSSDDAQDGDDEDDPPTQRRRTGRINNGGSGCLFRQTRRAEEKRSPPSDKDDDSEDRYSSEDAAPRKRRRAQGRGKGHGRPTKRKRQMEVYPAVRSPTTLHRFQSPQPPGYPTEHQAVPAQQEPAEASLPRGVKREFQSDDEDLYSRPPAQQARLSSVELVGPPHPPKPSTEWNDAIESSERPLRKPYAHELVQSWPPFEFPSCEPPLRPLRFRRYFLSHYLGGGPHSVRCGTTPEKRAANNHNIDVYFCLQDGWDPHMPKRPGDHGIRYMVTGDADESSVDFNDRLFPVFCKRSPNNWEYCGEYQMTSRLLVEGEWAQVPDKTKLLWASGFSGRKSWGRNFMISRRFYKEGEIMEPKDVLKLVDEGKIQFKTVTYECKGYSKELYNWLEKRHQKWTASKDGTKSEDPDEEDRVSDVSSDH